MEIYDPPPPSALRSRPTSGGRDDGAGRPGGSTMMGAAGASSGHHSGDFRRYQEERPFPRGVNGAAGFYRGEGGMLPRHDGGMAPRHEGGMLPRHEGGMLPRHLHHQQYANENQFQAMNPSSPMMAAAVAAAQRMARLGGGNGTPFPPLGIGPNMIHHHHHPHPPLPHQMARGGGGGGRGAGGGGMNNSPPPRARMPMAKGDWIPLTKLGRLVKEMKIKSLEEIFLYDLDILEPEIFDHFLGITIKEEVLAVVPTDKTLPTGERCVRFKALAVVGDCNGHVGLGVQISKEVAVAIAGANLMAKLRINPILRGFWGRPQAMTNQSLDRPHTLPCKVDGSFGSVTVRLVPAPRGSGCGSAPLVAQRILLLAGVEDAYFLSHGPTLDLGFLCKATLNALRETFAHFQEEVFRITKAPQHHMTPEIEELLHRFDINDKNANNNNDDDNTSGSWNRGTYGHEAQIKNVNLRLYEAQIHRDLGLTPPPPPPPTAPSSDVTSAFDAAFECTRPFDGGYNPLQMLHRSLKQQVLQPKFVPSSKRGPQLPPIPMRKRSLIPIVAPPPEDDDNNNNNNNGDDNDANNGGDNANPQANAASSVNSGFYENGASVNKGPRDQDDEIRETAPEVCLSLRPPPSSVGEVDKSQGEDGALTSSSSSSSSGDSSSQLDSPWRSLAPAFKAAASAAAAASSSSALPDEEDGNGN